MKIHYLSIFILVLLMLCVMGCDVSNPRSNATGPPTPLFLEYKIQGGFAGGTRYLFLITTAEMNTGAITNAVKREAYVVPEATAKEIAATLQKHDFFSWKSEESSKYADVFKMTLAVTTPSTNKEFVLFDTPDKNERTKKRLTKLVEELQDLAKRQGRFLK